MTCSRWLSLLLAWTLLLQSLTTPLPTAAQPSTFWEPGTSTMVTSQTLYNYDGDGNRVGLQRQQLGALGMGYGVVTSENHDFLVDTSQPYAEVIQEKTWLSDGAGNAIGDAPVIDRYDIGLDRLRVFRYQINANAPPTAIYSNWLLFDGLGSTRMVLGDSGAVVDEFGYNDAFGIPYRVTANGGRAVAGPGFFLNGQQWDGGSSWERSYWSGTPAFNSGEGLYFNRARYYQPGLGRFVGKDPYEGDKYQPSTLHRYLYASNDAINRIDPSGNVDTLVGQMNTMTIQGIIQTGVGHIGTIINVYNRFQIFQDVMEMTEIISKVLFAITGSPDPQTMIAGIFGALGINILEGGFSFSDFNAALGEMVSNVQHNWPDIAKAIEEKAGDIAQDVFSLGGKQQFNPGGGMAGAAQSGRLGIVFMLPSGIGGRDNEIYIKSPLSFHVGSERIKLEFSTNLGGGRLFGMGIRTSSSKVNQVFRIDYFDGRPYPKRPTVNPLHVHYHVWSEKHQREPRTSIWPI